MNDETTSKKPLVRMTGEKLESIPAPCSSATIRRNMSRFITGDMGVAGWPAAARICSAKTSNVSTCGAS